MFMRHIDGKERIRKSMVNFQHFLTGEICCINDSATAFGFHPKVFTENANGCAASF